MALFARLSEFLDRELDDEDLREMEKHLADCPPCQACLATLERTIRLCREACPRPVPPRMSARIRELIRQQHAARP